MSEHSPHPLRDFLQQKAKDSGLDNLQQVLPDPAAQVSNLLTSHTASSQAAAKAQEHQGEQSRSSHGTYCKQSCKEWLQTADSLES